LQAHILQQSGEKSCGPRSTVKYSAPIEKPASHSFRDAP